MNRLVSLFFAIGLSVLSYSPLSEARPTLRADALLERSAQYLNLYWGGSDIPDGAGNVRATWTIQMVQKPVTLDPAIKFWAGDILTPAERLPMGDGRWTLVDEDADSPFAEFYFTDLKKSVLYLDFLVNLELDVDGEISRSGPHMVRLWNSLVLDRADFRVADYSTGKSHYSGNCSGGPRDIQLTWTFYELWVRPDGSMFDGAKTYTVCTGKSGVITLPPHRFQPDAYYWSAGRTYASGEYVVSPGDFRTYISNVNGNAGNNPLLSSSWRVADVRPSWWPASGTDFPMVPPTSYGLVVEPVGVGVDASNDPSVSDYQGFFLDGRQPGIWFPPPWPTNATIIDL